MTCINCCNCRATSAVDIVTRETAMRSGQPAAAPISKRKRQSAPEEGCPYCSHTYTVRDGLSAKTDGDGERWVFSCDLRGSCPMTACKHSA